MEDYVFSSLKSVTVVGLFGDVTYGTCIMKTRDYFRLFCVLYRATDAIIDRQCHGHHRMAA
jgi:hypothetical protein